MRSSGRGRRLGRIAIAVSVAGLGVLLMPMRQDPALQAVFNAGHVPGFALLAALWAEDLLDRGWPRARRLLAVAFAGLLLSAATEGLQTLVPGRYADLADMFRNAFGIALGLAVHARWPGFLASRFRRG